MDWRSGGGERLPVEGGCPEHCQGSIIVGPSVTDLPEMRGFLPFLLNLSGLPMRGGRAGL